MDTAPGLRHRVDIDGLRALAVIPIVLFHLSSAVMPGGFVGVDVFFVISGYLITNLIVQRLAAGQFTFRQFYRARIRRLFPALFVMLAVSSAAAFATLPPDDLAEFGRTVISTTLFYSNMEFLGLSGYFAGSAELKPLLHTWSLAVEEQFYVLFPPFLVLAHRHVVQVRWLLWLAFAGSLVAGVYFVSAYQTFGFYFAGTRAFELLTGAVVAASPPRRAVASLASELAAALGALLIIGSVLLYSSATPFPGLAAVVPCVGTALIIHFGRNSEPLVSRILSAPPLVWIGKISYSLYLWHWPVIVFFRHWTLAALSPGQLVAALAVMLVLADLSYRLVETPGRQAPIADGPLFAGSATAAVAVVAIGVVFVSTDGLDDRFSPASLQLFNAESDWNPQRDRCLGDAARVLIPYADHCVFGSSSARPTVAVWADSHGSELAYELGQALRPSNVAVVQITTSGCPPALDFTTPGRPLCAQHNRGSLQALRDDETITTVVLAAYYDSHLKVDADRFAQGFERAVDELLRSGKEVMVIEPPPRYTYPVPAALGMLEHRGGEPGEHGQTRGDYESHNRQALKLIDKLKESRDSLDVIETSDVLCAQGWCPAFLDGAAVFRDEHHLSLHGARLVVDEIVSSLGPER